MDKISDQKTIARKAAFARRTSAHSHAAGLLAAQNLVEYLAPRSGQVHAGYLAIRTEVDPLPAMKEFARHAPVGVPVIAGNGQPLEFHRWYAGVDLVDGPFGVKIPRETEIVVPSIVIVPLLAFDKRGHRLGYGGGFYDRTLQQLRANHPVLAVGLAYAAQQIDALPHAATDQPLDAVVTEAGVQTWPA